MDDYIRPSYTVVVCLNCKHEHLCYADSNGEVKFKCSVCGTKTDYKIVSRRHVQVDVYAPKGQTLVGCYKRINTN